MIVLKIALIAVGGAILAMVVRQFEKEYSVFVILGVCLFLLTEIGSQLSVIVEFAGSLGEKIHISDTYIKILFKLLAVAYVCQMASNICQDLGYQSVSFQVEIIGKLSIFMLSIPILQSLLDMVEGFL